MDTLIRELNAGTLPYIPDMPDVVPSTYHQDTDKHKVVYSVTGTVTSSELSEYPLFSSGYSLPPEDIEQRVEDAVEDDDEKAWQTFLEIEPQYRTTNRWLAES